MTKSSLLFRPTRSLAVSLLALCGCEENEPQAGGEIRCEWVETEVPLDFRPEGTSVLSPAEVLDEIERPYRGELDWLGGAPWAVVEPTGGSSGMQSQLTRAGRVIFRRTLNEDGSDAVFGNRGWLCLAGYEIDAELQVATDDGVLDETWAATVSHKFLSKDTIAQVEIPELQEKLRIEQADEPPEPFVNGRLDLAVFYALRDPPNENEARGVLSYSGDLSSSIEAGGVMEESGFRVRLFEWTALPDD